jgi:hypothetical protein
MSVTVTGIKKTISKGTAITADSNAVRGMQVHDLAENLYGKMNRGRGADYPELLSDIKSRKKGTNAAVSIGTMRIQEIIATPFKQSPLFEKLYSIVEISIDEDIFGGQTVGESELIHVHEMAEEIERDYETCRKLYARGLTRPATTEEAPFGYFEKIYQEGVSPDQRKFRIRSTGWSKIKTASRTAELRDKLFEF